MPAQKSFFPKKSSSKVVLDGACALGRPFFCSNGRKQEERSVKAGRLRPMRFDRAAPHVCTAVWQTGRKSTILLG